MFAVVEGDDHAGDLAARLRNRFDLTDAEDNGHQSVELRSDSFVTIRVIPCD